MADAVPVIRVLDGWEEGSAKGGAGEGARGGSSGSEGAFSIPQEWESGSAWNRKEADVDRQRGVEKVA